MLEITCLFYYIISFGSLFLSHFYLKKRGNKFSQSFILLFGLLGLYVCLCNGWSHLHWIVYAFVSFTLITAFNDEATSNKPFLLGWALSIGILLHFLFHLPCQLYESQLRYARSAITMLLTYSVTIAFLQIQYLQQSSNKPNPSIRKSTYQCTLILIVASITYFNGLRTNYWDILTAVPAVLWAYAPQYTEIQLLELKQRKQRIQELQQKEKEYKSLEKQNDAKILNQQNTIKQLTSRNNQLQSKEAEASATIKAFTARAIQMEEAAKQRDLKIHEQEEQIGQLLQNEKAMQEQIQQLQNCLSSSEESAESVEHLEDV